MKKITLLVAFVSFFAIASFASSAVVPKAKSLAPVENLKPAAFFPVTFITSCGTYTGTGNCGDYGPAQCQAWLQDVANFLESLC